MALEYEVRAEFQSLSLAHLLDTPVRCFEGVGDNQEDLLDRYFKIKTVRQLANMPYFLWALGIQEKALQGGEPSSATVEEILKTEQLKFSVRDNERGKNSLELLNAPVNVLEGLTPGFYAVSVAWNDFATGTRWTSVAGIEVTLTAGASSEVWIEVQSSTL